MLFLTLVKLKMLKCFNSSIKLKLCFHFQKKRDQLSECIQKVSSNELQKDWLEPECLKPCPYTIMTAIKNKLAALKSNVKEKSIKELPSKLYQQLEVQNTHSDAENEIAHQNIIHESRKEHLEDINTASEIQNDTYASSIESIIASPEIPKLNLPASSSEHDVPELEIPAVCLTRKCKFQKRLGVESHLSSSSKEISNIVRATGKKDISAEIPKQARSVSSSRRNSVSVSEQMGENIHECATHVPNASTFLHNLKDSVATVNTNLSDHLKVLSSNITERDETHSSFVENIKRSKYCCSENSSVLCNETEANSAENSNAVSIHF